MLNILYYQIGSVMMKMQMLIMFPLLWAADSCLYAHVCAYVTPTSRHYNHTLCSFFYFAFMLKHFYTGEYDNKHMPNGITSNILIKNQMLAYTMMHSLSPLKLLKCLRSCCSVRVRCSSTPNQNFLFCMMVKWWKCCLPVARRWIVNLKRIFKSK